MMMLVGLVFGQDFYTIQVRSMSTEVPLTKAEIEAGIWQQKVGVLTKYFLGKYDTYEEAKLTLEPLRMTEYKGAFIVSSQKLNGYQSPQPVMAEPVTESKPVVKSQTSSSSKIYTVQIAAYRYPLYGKDFNLTDPVMEFYCSDNIYRYTVGKVSDEQQARILLRKIKKSGFPDAFLIDYKKYEVYRIE